MAYNTLFNGTFTNSSQPRFFAYFSSTASNQTGDGTAYQCVFDTEVVDQGGIYNNSTGLFTAPVDGRYLLSCGLIYTNASGGSTGTAMFLGSADQFFFSRPIPNSSGVGISGSLILEMSATDTMYVEATWFGTTKTIGIQGGALSGGFASWFSGYLLG